MTDLAEIQVTHREIVDALAVVRTLVRDLADPTRNPNATAEAPYLPHKALAVGVSVLTSLVNRSTPDALCASCGGEGCKWCYETGFTLKTFGCKFANDKQRAVWARITRQPEDDFMSGAEFLRRMDALGIEKGWRYRDFVKFRREMEIRI